MPGIITEIVVIPARQVALRRTDCGWRRSPHIHFMLRSLGTKTLVTQLFFADAPYLQEDPFVKQSLIIRLERKHSADAAYWHGRFDIVVVADVGEQG